MFYQKRRRRRLLGADMLDLKAGATHHPHPPPSELDTLAHPGSGGNGSAGAAGEPRKSLPPGGTAAAGALAGQVRLPYRTWTLVSDCP